jgi:hypothetical protein
MEWLKKNIGWAGPSIFIVAALLTWATGLFGFMVEIEAEPIAKEVATAEVQIHELKVEPRLQAIEYQVTEQRKVNEAQLEVQQKTLEVLEKIEAK